MMVKGQEDTRVKGGDVDMIHMTIKERVDFDFLPQDFGNVVSKLRHVHSDLIIGYLHGSFGHVHSNLSLGRVHGGRGRATW